MISVDLEHIAKSISVQQPLMRFQKQMIDTQEGTKLLNFN